MSHIEAIIDRHDIETEQARRDWAVVTGKERVLRQNMYVDTRTGERYCSIIGAVAYPFEQPGCYIVAGIQSEPVSRVCVLDYAEFSGLYDLITAMATTQIEYGCMGSQDVLPTWIGDPERYLNIISKAAQEMERNHDISFGMYIREPVDWQDSSRRFSIWARHLFQAMKDSRVYISGAQSGAIELKQRLQEFPHDGVTAGSIEKFPSVGCLAALVYTVGIERTWERDRGLRNQGAFIIEELKEENGEHETWA